MEGKKFVTARAWDDLSQMIRLYEQHGFAVNEMLVIQYLQEDKIAKNFAIYYDLFNKYKSDYKVVEILAGKASPEIKKRAKSAKFDERISLLGLLLDGVTSELRAVMEREQSLGELLEVLKKVVGEMNLPGVDPVNILEKHIEEMRTMVARSSSAGSLSAEAHRSANRVIAALEDQRKMLLNKTAGVDGKTAIRLVKEDFDRRVASLTKEAKKAGVKLGNLFNFVEEVFGEGQEVLVLVTELTMNYHAARFISRFGSKEYFKHNKELLFYERQKELILEVEKLGI